MTIVEKIHAEFDNAQEEILQKAEELISNSEINPEYVKTLESLGFIKSNSVAIFNERKEEIDKNKAMAEIVMHYKTTYPFLKFLTEDKLEEICKKYNLIYAPVSSYKKDVPPKNLKEIVDAQELNKSDRPKRAFKVHISSYISNVPHTVRKWVDDHIWDTDNIDDFKIKKECPYKFDGSWIYTNRGIEVTEIKKGGLFIAAPKDHFDLSDLSKDKKGWFKTKLISKPVPDPIVFRYVNGGIQVLSKWGDEAEDVNLTNEIMN